MRRLRIPDTPGALGELLAIAPFGVHERDGELVAHGPGFTEGEPVSETAVERLTELARAPVIDGRLLVRAAWMAPERGVAEVVIEDAGGFGSGAHPTTRDCLSLLLGLEPAGAFTDLGCGSGVLAIAAAQQGWGPVSALDSAPESVAAARANAARNGVAIDVTQTDLLHFAPPAADALAANVPARVHHAIAAGLAEAPRSLIASGFTTAERGPLIDSYARTGLCPVQERETEGWTTVLLAPGTPRPLQPGRKPSHYETHLGPVGGAGQRPRQPGRKPSHYETHLGPVGPAPLPPERPDLPLLGERLAEQGARAVLLNLPGGVLLDVWVLGDALRWALRAPENTTLEVLEEALLSPGPASEVLLRLALSAGAGVCTRVDLVIAVAPATETGLFELRVHGAVSA